jgi:pilus assembly protein CpaB
MPRRILLLFVALLIAATATVLTQRWLGARLAGAAVAAPVTVEVLVAARALDSGSVIGPGALEWAHWPVDAARGLKQRGTTNMASFNGAVVRSALLAGEPVTAARLVQPGTRGPMAAVLAPGARAVTISVTPASGMAGFVVPGDRVDLLLTQTLAGGDGRAERHLSQVVLHDVRVLGTDQHGAGGGAGDVAAAALDSSAGAAMLGGNADVAAPPTTVTLEVSPKGAELVAVAAELGKLSLSLRSLVGGTAAPHGPTWDSDASSVLPRRVAVAPAPVAAPPMAVAAAPAPQAPPQSASSIVVRGIGSSPSEATP